MEGKRDRRMLGRRVRELDRVRRVDGPGLVGGDSVGSVGCPCECSGSPAGSMGSMLKRQDEPKAQGLNFS